jgi:hypothetical protein
MENANEEAGDTKEAWARSKFWSERKFFKAGDENVDNN